jgi:molybdate transport repressor ModE-like protein
MLDVKRMRILKEVADHGSFSAAAESLSYTQSAISQQIATLEREAGTQLVERNARGIRMTDAGQALVNHADVILARLVAAERELEAIAGLQGGTLRLVGFPSAAASVLPLAVARFRERHPAVELTLEPREPDESLAVVKAGDADVALTVEAPWDPIAIEGLTTRHVLDDEMFVALPRGHALGSEARVRLEDLAGEAWIQGTTQATCPDTRILLRACAAAGFEPRLAFQSDDYGAIQGFIAAGVGVALIPELGLATVRDDIVIRPLTGTPPYRRVLAATHDGASRGPAAEAMLEILEEVGREWVTRLDRARDLQLVS